ncbi:MAG: DUF2283 domain-containing protein [Bacteroidales bacterium]
MKFTYDKEADALYIKLTDKSVYESEEVGDDIVADFDNENSIVGIEVLNFVEKHRQDFFTVFKQVEQSIWKLDEAAI